MFFSKAVAFTGLTREKISIFIDDLGCPHKPKALAKGKMAIYTFQRDGQYLKIGKVGQKSNARFQNQHYGAHRAKSNLAKSLLHDPDLNMYSLNENNIDEWIRNNIQRIDLLIDPIDTRTDVFVLNLLEAFLHWQVSSKVAEGGYRDGQEE